MKEYKIISFLKFFGAVFLLLFCLLPFIWMIIISLTKNPDFLSSGQSVSFTFTNYTDLLSSSSTHLLDYLKNSIIVSIISAFCATSVCKLIGLCNYTFNFPGKNCNSVGASCILYVSSNKHNRLFI